MDRMDTGHRLGRITLAAMCLALMSLYLAQGTLPHGTMRVLIFALVIAGSGALAWTYVSYSLLVPGRGGKVVAGMTSDVCLLTALALMETPAAGLSYVTMIWLTLRTGLRYGRGYLLLGMALSVAGFAAFLANGPLMAEFPWFSLGLVVGLIAIPLYMWTVCEALMAARDRATEADVAKGRFLAHMSHEFRTPLNGIQGLADLLGSCDISPDARGYVTGIHVSATNLSKTVRELLDFATIEAGRIVVRPDTFSVKEVVDLVMVDVQSLINKKGLESRICIADNVPQYVYGSGEHARRALLSIVCNAVKFTNKGWIEIHVSHQQRGNDKLNLCFRVRDSGPGFNQDVGDRIFHPFEHADETSRHSGGSGLGLAIAKGFVEANNGDIGYRATPGVGTEFWFTFEVERVAHAPVSLPPLSSQDLSSADSISRSVLVVDDQSLNRTVLEAMLSKAGHEVESVSSGALGIASLINKWVDIAIIDLHMPVLTGSDMVKWIRDREKARGLPRMPILVLTADASDEARHTALEAGASHVLTKPIAMPDLREYVRIATSTSAWASGNVSFAQAAGCYLTELQHTLDQVDVFEKIVQTCITDLELGIEQLRAAISRHDRLLIQEAAHAVKGLAGTLGMELLAKEADALETACRLREPADADCPSMMQRIDECSRDGMHVVRGRFLQQSDAAATN